MGYEPMVRCYYTILGIETGASQARIKQAFRGIAMRLHPDRNPGDPKAKERFREAMEAYDTLSDPRRRRHYDRQRGRATGASGGRGETRQWSTEPSRTPEDVFREYFGINRQGPSRNRRYDLRFDLQVAAGDVTRELSDHIQYSRVVFCQCCMGAGRGRNDCSCARCGGTGEIEEFVRMKITIPAGCEDGARLRVPGGGDRPAPPSQPGDLIVLIHVTPY